MHAQQHMTNAERIIWAERVSELRVKPRRERQRRARHLVRAGYDGPKELSIGRSGSHMVLTYFVGSNYRRPAKMARAPTDVRTLAAIHHRRPYFPDAAGIPHH